MDNTRQRMPKITIGILHRRGSVDDEDLKALVEWIVKDRVAILTGHFSTSPHMVQALATQAGAIHSTPRYQPVLLYHDRTQVLEVYTHPSYFLLFGRWRRVQWPQYVDVVTEDIVLGKDILDNMIPESQISTWANNDAGSAFVPNHGNIKMKAVDFTRWCSHCFQTCLWLGTSTPSKKSQDKYKNRSRGKGSKGSGKDKDKGKGKGKGVLK